MGSKGTRQARGILRSDSEIKHLGGLEEWVGRVMLGKQKKKEK